MMSKKPSKYRRKLSRDGVLKGKNRAEWHTKMQKEMQRWW